MDSMCIIWSFGDVQIAMGGTVGITRISAKFGRPAYPQGEISQGRGFMPIFT